MYVSNRAYHPVHAGDRIAQLVIEKISTPEVQEEDVLTKSSANESQSLDDTVRGSGGFGSTGGFTSV